ncbi:MAG TPA: WXG100 family type VII secretion target [Micromonosporaceae bacterium]|nr:WXG100 family type VII secretion target [Micromonosporaceae bacterium]
MVDFAVDSEMLRRQSQSVITTAGDISGSLQTVTGQVRELTAHWTGGSSDAFQNLWHDWETGAKQLLDAMDGIGKYLDRAAQTFEDAERAVTEGAR